MCQPTYRFALVPNARDRGAAPQDLITYGNRFSNSLFEAVTSYILPDTTPLSLSVDITLEQPPVSNIILTSVMVQYRYV